MLRLAFRAVPSYGFAVRRRVRTQVTDWYLNAAEVFVPRIKSAAKRMRQARTRTAHNRTHRSKLRTALKKVRAAAGAEAQKAYDEAVKLLDRAGRKRLVHPNAAARQKSRLAKVVGKAKGKVKS